MLLNKGVDVNTQNGKYGNTLQATSYEAHNKVIRLLLSHNAILYRKDVQGRTPIHLTSAEGRMRIIEILSNFGLNPTIIDTQRRNCLHHAASKGSIEILNWLLNKGFDPNYVDRDSWISLHWAVKHGSVNIIKILKIADIRSIIEIIKNWISELVFIFHYYNFVSIFCGNEKSELTTKWNINSSIAIIESINNEYKINLDIWQNEYYCNNCFLINFNFINFLNFFIW